MALKVHDKWGGVREQRIIETDIFTQGTEPGELYFCEH